MASIRKRAWVSAEERRIAERESRTPVKDREAWQVDFIDQDGNRHQPQFNRRSDADHWLVDARAKVRVGTYTPDATSATIAEAIDLWIGRAAAEGLEHSTREQYRQHRAHILAVIDGRTRLSRFTQARCEQMRDDLLQAHSRPMARKVLQSFRSVIKDAKRRGLIAHNVAAETAIGAARRHARKLKVGVDVPLPEEIKAMLAAAADQPKTLSLVCATGLAGLRPSELRGLAWANVNLGAQPTVTVEERADKWCRTGPPKSEAAQRTIPLSETAARALRAWKLAQPPGRRLVFGTSTDRPDMLGNIQRRLLDPLMAQAGTRRYSPHKLRHYAISAWLRSCGGNFKLVQYWAGHATLTLTLDTYGHLIPRPNDHAVIAAAEQDLFGS